MEENPSRSLQQNRETERAVLEIGARFMANFAHPHDFGAPRGTLAGELHRIARDCGLVVRGYSGSNHSGWMDAIDTLLIDLIHPTSHSKGLLRAIIDTKAKYLAQGITIPEEAIIEELLRDPYGAMYGAFFTRLAQEGYLDGRDALVTENFQAHDGEISWMHTPSLPAQFITCEITPFDGYHTVHDTTTSPFLRGAYPTLVQPKTQRPQVPTYLLDDDALKQKINTATETLELISSAVGNEARDSARAIAMQRSVDAYHRAIAVVQRLGPLLEAHRHAFILYGKWDICAWEQPISGTTPSSIDTALEGRTCMILSPEHGITLRDYRADLDSRLRSRAQERQAATQ